MLHEDISRLDMFGGLRTVRGCSDFGAPASHSAHRAGDDATQPGCPEKK
jgi:hypothetical protein